MGLISCPCRHRRIDCRRFANQARHSSRRVNKTPYHPPVHVPHCVLVQTRKQREKETIDFNELALTESSEGSSLYLCAGGGPRSGWTTAVMVGPRPSQRTQRMESESCFLSGMIQITRAKYTGLEEQEQQKKNKNRRNKALIKSMRSQNVFFFLGFLSSAKHK